MVSSWTFDNNSFQSATNKTLVFTNASVLNSALTLGTSGTPKAECTDSAFPTLSYELAFDIKIAGNLHATDDRIIFSYGTLIGYLKTNGSIMVKSGTDTATSATGVIVVGTKHRVVVRRALVPNTTSEPNANLNSTLTVMIDNVSRINITGTGVPLHALTSPVTLTLGGDAAYSATVTFDDVRLETVTLPTNAYSTGAGIQVSGDGRVNNRGCDRSITWNQPSLGSQESAETSGSYWHIQGGRIMFSRVIDTQKRKAPGSNVYLKDLPSRVTNIEPHLWKLATSSVNSGVYTTADNGTLLKPLTYSNKYDNWLGEWLFTTGLSNTGSGANKTDFYSVME
eukprot:jgi/Mesvir1/28664/Mv21280-RA.1